MQQFVFAGPPLGQRGQHAAGHPGRALAQSRIMQYHPVTVLAQTKCCRQSDDASADNDDMHEIHILTPCARMIGFRY